ncbi:uncharacterized protein LOC131615096 [Vicia villosa]|uniref:uncharacterized protein LOC131615096 n=1 Tax=Vicia villosa TaxID=3911 RepID=UPI00273AC72C|nr:uncharacterized protein LOC131615096 [Vicia villosa]
MIIVWGEVAGYTESMSHASAFIPLRRNQVSDPYRNYLDYMDVEDTCCDCYANHREKVIWDDVALYSGWLACSSTITVRYLPERVMRQLGHCQTIPHHPHVCAHIRMTRRQIDEAFTDFEHHMVPDKAQETKEEVDLGVYMGWVGLG